MNETGFWDTAYRDNAPALLGVLRRYVKETGVAQDLLHEVFITAINKYGSYAGKGCFEGWLHRIAVNTALMYLRSEKKRQVPAEAVLSALEADDDASDDRSGNARAAIEAVGFSGEELLAAVDRLPEHYKLVFNMYVMDDFSHRQIGAELNIPPGTSKSYLARARKRIQQFLYDDALNRNRIRDRRRASAFVPLLPVRMHFIDRLYRKGLSDFLIPPAGDTGFLSVALEQQAAPVATAISQTVATASQTAASTTAQAVSATAFWGGKLSYAILCCGASTLTGAACWLLMSGDSPLNRTGDTAIPAADIRLYPSKPATADSITCDATNHAGFAVPDAPPPHETEQAQNPGSASKRESPPIPATESHTGSPEPRWISATQRPSNGHTVSNLSAGKTPPPVVVRKRIIQRQTVVVRDTVVIAE